MNQSTFLQILPFIILSAGIVVAILVEIFTTKGKALLPAFFSVLFLANSLLSLAQINVSSNLYQMLALGGKAAFFNFIFSIGALIAVMSSVNYVKKYGANFGEYYILLASSVLGMMLMAGALDLFVVFLGLEVMSINFYILAGINRKKKTANEASLKYFLLGAFATGFVVYGIGLIYGSAGNTNLNFIINNFTRLLKMPLFVIGLGLFFVGFSFKIAAFPFHMWVPDVYQGAATSVTGLMSTIGKAAAFSVLIFAISPVTFNGAEHIFRPYFATLAILSTLYASIVAIAQTNLKRMLAYSSIVHAGYMSIGLAAGNVYSVAGIIFYLAAYTFMNLGAFGVIAIVEDENDGKTDLKAFAGLHKKNPMLAGFMALFMFALAGIPPLAGFFGKYYVFVGAIKQNLLYLALVGITASLISVYFYLRVVVYMYFKDEEEDFEIKTDYPGMFAVLVSGIFVLIFGVFPSILMKLITSVLR